MTKPNKSKTNIGLGVRYKDSRNQKIYRSMEYLENFTKLRCQNQQKISVVFCIKIAEKYFIEI